MEEHYDMRMRPILFAPLAIPGVPPQNVIAQRLMHYNGMLESGIFLPLKKCILRECVNFEDFNFLFTGIRQLMGEIISDFSSFQSQPLAQGDSNTERIMARLQAYVQLLVKRRARIFSKEAVPYGIYNFSNAGQTSWFDFAVEIQRLLKKRKLVTNDCKVLPCSTEEYGAKVERPAYSVLSKEKIQAALKIKIPGWKDSLNKFIKAEQGELLCEN